MDARRLEKCRSWLYSARPFIGRFQSRFALWRLSRSRTPNCIRLLADALTIHGDQRTRNSILSILWRLQAHQVDAVCEVWSEKRHSVLASFLKERKWIPSKPTDLRVLCALKIDQLNGVLKLGTSVVPALIHAARDVDPEIASRAGAILERLEDPELIEEFCERLTRMEYGNLHKIAVRKGFAPKNPGKRALFFFLTGQYERYDELDFDKAMLRACYEAGESDVRHSIADRIRTSGRTDLTEVLHGRREKRQLAEMTPREWETVVTVLRERRRYTDLWALAFESPPEWSSEILGILKNACFQPESECDAALFDRLLKLRPGEGKRSRLYVPVPWCKTVLNTEEHGIRSLAMSPDGKTLAAVNSDTSSILWILRNGWSRINLTRRMGLALNAAFSPDGKSLVVGNTDNTARAYETSGWRMIATCRGHSDRISGIAVSTDNATIGTAGYDNTARLWDLSDGKCRSVLRGHEQSVLALAFSPDGQTVATGSHDESARIWFVSGGGLKFVLTGNLGSVCSVAFSPDGRTLATGSSEGTVRLWHCATGEIKAVLQVQKGSIMTLAFSSDGARLAAGSLDKTVALWDIPSGKVKAVLTGHTDEVHAIAFSPDGKTLVSGGRDRTVRIWQIAEQKALISMTRDDLQHIQLQAAASMNPFDARPWHFTAALLRHRFRFDIELIEVAERVFGEFEIEIEDAKTAG